MFIGKTRHLATISILFLLLISAHITAQNIPPEETPEATPDVPVGPVPSVVTVEAADGRTLVADYYAPAGVGYGPVALLLHELYTTSASWEPFIDPLLANGYRVVTPDIRGYGRTGGRINWPQAQADTLTWLNWICEQPETQLDAVFTVGSSMGSSLALVGCATAEHCAGAVAISPGLRYFGVYTENVVTSGMTALLIYAEGDYYPARDVPLMLELAEENGLDTLTAHAYPGRAHGIQLFMEDEFIPTIITWMNLHGP